MVNYFASTGWLTVYFIASILYLKLVISQPKDYAILMQLFVRTGRKPGQDAMFFILQNGLRFKHFKIFRPFLSKSIAIFNKLNIRKFFK